jgi:hypothetical protein
MLYNTASNFLSHVVAVEPPPPAAAEAAQPSPERPSFQRENNPKEPQTLVDFIYDLAGVSEREPPPKERVEEIFDAGIEESDADERAIPSEYQNAHDPIAKPEPDVYIPTVDTHVQHDEPIFSSSLFKQVSFVHKAKTTLADFGA